MKLWSREEQCAALDELLASVRIGVGGVLLVRGERGIGKTALLDYCTSAAADLQVVHAGGVKYEMGIPFAGLHQLCKEMAHLFHQLPEPQLAALNVALGEEPGDPPSNLLIALALFSLLSDTASRGPLLCVVDDAQWLDRESLRALSFVARRIHGQQIAMVIATDDEVRCEELEGFPELVLTRLPDEDARDLLASVLPGRVDERVRDRVIAESGGNPRTLLEFGSTTSALEFAGGFGVPRSLTKHVEQFYRSRADGLPQEARRLLLLAAVEPVGDPALLYRAADALGITDAAVEAAETAGLLSIGARVTYRHPLLRSAVYQAAPVAERRLVHRALAETADPDHDPDLRVWHLAQALHRPDEEIAAELERLAQRAWTRGGLAATAAFLDRSTTLTPDPTRRAVRALKAAEVATVAGGVEQAVRLVALAKAGPVTEELAARIDLARAKIAFLVGCSRKAPAMFLKAARRLEPFDPALVREGYMFALSAAVHKAHLATGGGVHDVASAVRAAPAAAGPAHVADLLLEGFATSITDGYASGAPLLDRALGALEESGAASKHELKWLIMAGPAAQLRWDLPAWDRSSDRFVRASRAAGALMMLSPALSQQAVLCLLRGDLDDAARVVNDAFAASRAVGGRLPHEVQLALNVFQGSVTVAEDMLELATADLLNRGEGMRLIFVQWAAAVLYNGLGRYQDALRIARSAAQHSDEHLYSVWLCAELVEAAVRCEEADVVPSALARLGESANASGSDWAAGVEKAARALTLEGPAAETLYREALDHLSATGLRFPLARAHLLYGEWLRRQHRRREARIQLETALDLFTTIGAAGFTERVMRELRAAGDRTQNRSAALTGQEYQIAALASSGLSNPEIAAQLYISRRTVEYHLGKIFAKLDITSRNQLGDALADVDPVPTPDPESFR